jgi:hypothetical protein
MLAIIAVWQAPPKESCAQRLNNALVLRAKYRKLMHENSEPKYFKKVASYARDFEWA